MVILILFLGKAGLLAPEFPCPKVFVRNDEAETGRLVAISPLISAK